MDWVEKIRIGMELIREGCVENQIPSLCKICPFYEHCYNSNITEPDWWDEDKEGGIIHD